MKILHTCVMIEVIYYGAKFEANWIKIEKVIFSSPVVADFGCLSSALFNNIIIN